MNFSLMLRPTGALHVMKRVLVGLSLFYGMRPKRQETFDSLGLTSKDLKELDNVTLKYYTPTML